MENDDYDMQPSFSYIVDDNRQLFDSGVLFLNPCNSNVYAEAGDLPCFIFSDKELPDDILKYGDVENVNALQDIKLKFWEMDEAVLLICLLIVFLCGLIAHNYLTCIKSFREYGIYYMLGITWKQLVMVISCQNVVAFFLGFFMGTSFVYSNYKHAVIYMKLLFSWKLQMAVCLGVALVYLISIVPVVLKLKHISPVDLMRKR